MCARFLLTIVLSLLVPQVTTAQAPAPRPVGPFELEPVNSAPLSLQDLRGSVVGVLVIDAADCAPCDSAISTAGRIRDELQGQGLEVVAVAIVNGAVAQTAFALRVALQGISIPVAPTDSQALSAFSGLPEADVLNLAVPYLFVVDREGLIREDHAFDAGSGPANYWDDAETNMRGSFQMWLPQGRQHQRVR